MIVITETGSRYEFDMQELKMRRANKDWSLRRDNEWIKMFEKPDIVIGKEMTIFLEPLGYGDITTRMTTRVIEIEHDRS